MLRPSALRQLLSQITVGTIQATILTTRSGEFLDYVVKNEHSTNFNIKNVCAIVCALYQSFHKFSSSIDDDLNYLIVDCDAYRIAIRPVNNHLVCICADSNTGLGILKLKINSLSDSLSKNRNSF
jgi:hypothetical protein